MPIYLPPISRRSFLAGSLAAGTGTLLGHDACWPPSRKTDPNRWVLISDTHIGTHREDAHHGTKPAENFAKTVGQVLALDPRPAGIIISGDLAFLKGQPGDYKLIRELYQPIREAGIPLHLVLGNHDQRENFWAAFPEAKPAPPAADRQAAVVETPLANWFLMDSLYQTNVTPGLLGKEQLQWLAKALEARTDKPALLVAHHNLDGLIGTARRGLSLAIRRRSRAGEGLFLRPYAPVEGRLRERDSPRQRARHGMALRCQGAAGLAGHHLAEGRRDGRDERPGQEARQAWRAARVEMADVNHFPSSGRCMRHDQAG